MPAPEAIRQLVERFDDNKAAYHSPHYNEAQLRQEFLNPFFKALGWDVYNEKDYALQYREVIHEDSIHIKGSPNAKAPDYAFRLGGVRKFFVEAKKPAEDIQNTKEYAYQLKIYAWNSSLPLSILTDFEEFAVYDCRSKPNLSDSPATGRIMYVKYDEYLEKWDDIAGIFSPDAIRKGAFDKYAEDNTAKKGTIKVDDAFLEEIETWRTLLARNIALRNEQIINERQLNFAVQMTIDRIIFLRISEDRGIEPPNQLQELIKDDQIYKRLVDLFERADLKYNSGLFHFKAESGNKNNVDTFTPSLVIDDKVLKTIIKSLYYPCPYVFKEIPVEILGQVYEQFLGKVIRLTPGGRAKIEEKPEVRKAGGVYYTPKYIVDYIVENTVGKLLEDKTPDQAARLKIVDPACGSGSFLLGAFQYLMDWHEDYYLAHDPEKWTKGRDPALVHTADGDWRLTTDEKKRILVNNIHGVDIDQQAVEVTKLSLLLKVLEEETGQLTLGFERALPDLNDNIKCGNSLINWDYFEGQLLPDRAEVKRVNPFDWEKNFPEVFDQGGFDAVIGNPPYIRIQAMKKWASGEVDFIKNNYMSASKGNYDVYVVFIEKGMSLLHKTGALGFILPHKFFTSSYGEPLRKIISNGKHLSKVIHFSDQQVFENATTYTCLLFLSSSHQRKFSFCKVTNIEDWITKNHCDFGLIDSEKYSNEVWNFVVGGKAIVYEKLLKTPHNLGDICSFFVGLQTSSDTVFLFKEAHLSDQENTKVFSKALNISIDLENALLKPVVRSGEIGRYWANPNALVLFPYEISNGKFQLINEQKLRNKYPNSWNYLLANKKQLESREHGKFKGSGWYQLYPKNLDLWEQQKIMVPYMVTRLSAYHDEDNLYFVNVTTGGFGITINEGNYSYKYLTAILNSKLINFFFKCISSNFHGGYYAANKQFLTQLPIQPITLESTNDVNFHNNFESLVDHMQKLHKRSPQTPYEQELLQREIDATDAQIDRLVYDLYGLTEEEIKIVEGETRSK